MHYLQQHFVIGAVRYVLIRKINLTTTLGCFDILYLMIKVSHHSIQVSSRKWKKTWCSQVSVKRFQYFVWHFSTLLNEVKVRDCQKNAKYSTVGKIQINVKFMLNNIFSLLIYSWRQAASPASLYWLGCFHLGNHTSSCFWRSSSSDGERSLWTLWVF